MLKILYIDDEEVNLSLFEQAFRRDFIVFKSISAEKALEIYKNEDIDVVVTDLKMPVMNGIELIREIKKLNPNKTCFLLTGYYEPSLANDPEVQSIVHKYVLKPFRRQELKQDIIEACT